MCNNFYKWYVSLLSFRLIFILFSIMCFHFINFQKDKWVFLKKWAVPSWMLTTWPVFLQFLLSAGCCAGYLTHLVAFCSNPTWSNSEGMETYLIYLRGWRLNALVGAHPSSKKLNPVSNPILNYKARAFMCCYVATTEHLPCTRHCTS